jgi:hypothetical protein
VADGRAVPTITPRCQVEGIPNEHKQILLTDIKRNRARDAVRASASSLHISTTSALIANRQNGSWRPASPHGWYSREGRADSPTQSARNPRCRLARDGSDDPGAVFFLPDEAPRQIAEVTAAALKQASRS